MRILVVARHAILSRHIAALCADAGGDCRTAVGSDEGLRSARSEAPDVVLCEVDLLAPEALGDWARELEAARVPLLAVSLTRRQNESPVVAGTLLAGYLYLPTLGRADLSRVLYAATGHGASAPANAYRWSVVAEPTPAIYIPARCTGGGPPASPA
ncbi:MAG TPA: response regulator [Gemmatimonadaceae bacterium]|nr:response regulator [Gemmatimonadaceae bacterium]